ncbi:MAG: diguanylate cyclase domain-containing protein [Vibrio sp.]
MTIKKKLSLLLIFLFVFSFSNILFIYTLENRNDDATLSIQHANTVLKTTDRLLLSLTKAETSQRGYLLTQDRYYLEKFYAALRDTKDDFEDLKSVVRTGIGIGQKMALDRLDKSIDAKVSELKSTLKSGEINHTQAVSIISSESGKVYMESVTKYADTINVNEQNHLTELRGEHERITVYINTVTVVEFLVMIFFAIATYAIMQRSLFDPLGKLLHATKKMEEGERQQLADFLPKDEMGYLMNSFYEMSEVIIERHEELQAKAHTDELTKVNNRLGLHKDIEASIATSKIDDASLVLCFIDLDEFKQMNDKLGHDCGDELLKTVANRLKESLRTTDAIYRYGGDEFIVLMKGVASVAKAHQLVGNLMESVSEPFLYHGEMLPVKFSLGYALSPEHATDPETLIKYADIAMYQSKAERKQQAKFFDISMLEEAEKAD